MKQLIFGVGLALIITLPALAAQNAKTLAPGVAAVYQQAIAGTLKTTNAKGAPRQAQLGPRFDARGRVEVDIQYRGAADLAALRALGANIKLSVAALKTVEITVPPRYLRWLASLPWVVRVRFPHYTFTNGTASGAASASVDARAKQVMHVDQLRKAIATTGKGINVLVISDGADHHADAAKAGLLPSSIYVDSKVSGHGDEGTAMLEVVHAIAPDAQLGFCGPASDVAELACLNDEVSTFSATIIVTDLNYVGVDAYHGGGSFLTGIRTFIGAHPDVVFINIAGNSAQKFFQGPYTASANPQNIGGQQYKSVEDFGAATGKISDTGDTFSLTANETTVIDLQWDDNWVNPTESYALFLLDNSGNVLAAAKARQQPDRYIQYTNSGKATQAVNIVVACASPTCSKRFFIKGLHLNKAAFQYGSSASSADAIGVIKGVVSVGAVYVSTPDKIDPESGRGPALSDGSIQPTFVAPDCVAYVGYGSFSGSTFCGTSAAAPQVAGVLALLESSPLPGDVQALINGAVDLGTKGQDNTYGYGRIDAKAAEASLDTPPTVSSTSAFTVTAGKSHNGQFKGALSDTASKAGLALQYAITKQPTHGTVKLDAKTGTYTYTATSGYSGNDSFQYASSDGLTQSKSQTASVTVKAPQSTTPPPPPHNGGNGGGGGAFGLLALFGLLVLTRLRFREGREH
jgi:hypothetical protein